MANFHRIGLNLSLEFTNSSSSPLLLHSCFSIQILPLRATDFFALQQIIQYRFPTQSQDDASFSPCPARFSTRIPSVGVRFLTRLSFVKSELQVSPGSLGNVMCLTQSFLFWSDDLVVGLHLLLSSASTAVMPAPPLFVHRPNPTLAEKQNAPSKIIRRRHARSV